MVTLSLVQCNFKKNVNYILNKLNLVNAWLFTLLEPLTIHSNYILNKSNLVDFSLSMLFEPFVICSNITMYY